MTAARARSPLPAILGIVLTVLAQSLDGKVLPPVLPLIRGDFALSPDEGDWIPIVYLMCSFALLPLGPWCVDRFGRRRVVLLSSCGYIAAALAAASAPDVLVLLVARALQGACGAGMISTCHAALRETFPDAKLGVSQVAFVGSFVGLPLALGPFIGGTLYDNQISWRWMFVIEALIGVAGLALCLRRLPERSPAPERQPLDVTGAALLALALAPLQYILYQGDRYGWWDDANICALTLLSGVALAGFIAWEVRGSRAPLINVRALARRPAVLAGIALSLPVGLCLSGSVSLIVAFVQQVLGFTASLAGELAVVRALSIIPVAVFFGMVMDKRRPPARAVVPIGLALLALSTVLQAVATTSDSDFATGIIAMIAGGFAIGPTIVPLLWTVFGSIPRLSADTLRVATVMDMSLQLGTITATTLIATMLDRRFSFHYEVLRSTTTLARLAATGVPAHVNARALMDLAMQQAYVLAFADTALAIGLVALLSIPLAVLLRRTDEKAHALEKVPVWTASGAGFAASDSAGGWSPVLERAG